MNVPSVTPEQGTALMARYPSQFAEFTTYTEAYNNSLNVSAGWYGLIEQLCADIEAAQGGREFFRWPQFKSKFGALCAYHRMTGAKPGDAGTAAAVVNARTLVTEAVLKSIHLCELCGSPRAQRYNVSFHIVTLCDEHIEAVWDQPHPYKAI